ncbi:MAG: hypothetical protein BMS9Abin15_0185 [Gammaproteobacteria bacterium]|nr:MAG: hypothetical protein BMS9Abin15_0185 [Gammaproteobacteria bacterium]
MADGELALSGELNYQTVPGLWKKTLVLLSQGAVSSIDLKDVTRADSAGIAYLIEVICEARKRHQAVDVRHIPDQLTAIGAVSGLQQILGKH